MAHFIDTAYGAPPERLYSYTLGLRTLKQTRRVYRSQEVVEELLDARWGGKLTIPEQHGPKFNPENLRSNDLIDNAYSRLDPITWIEDFMGGLNTSEFGLWVPTVETDASNYYNLLGSPVLEDNRLKASVNAVGNPGTAARGLYVKFAGSSPRIYKLVAVDRTTWHLVPGRLPWSDVTRIETADTMRFRILNPNQIEEYLNYTTRGTSSLDWIEAR